MERFCLICETKLDGRADAKTCSDKCKKALQRIKGTEGGQEVVLESSLKGTFVKGDSPELIERGQKVAEKKMEELKGTSLPEVSLDDPCNTGIEKGKDGEVYLDLEKDLHLDLKKDFGCFAVSRNGWCIRPDITIQQVRNIRRVVEAKNGWPHRTYEHMDSATPYSTVKLGARV